MRRGHMNDEAPLGLLGETHSVGKGMLLSAPSSVLYLSTIVPVAPTVQPRSVEHPDHLLGPGANPYRPDLRAPQQQFFDLDLDLNPDL